MSLRRKSRRLRMLLMNNTGMPYEAFVTFQGQGVEFQGSFVSWQGNIFL